MDTKKETRRGWKLKPCEKCGKLLTSRNYFKDCDVCLDCLFAENGFALKCCACNKRLSRSDFARTIKYNMREYAARRCNRCHDMRIEIGPAISKSLASNRRKHCSVCGGSPTERDGGKYKAGVYLYGGKLTAGKCSDCFLSEYKDDTPTIDEIIDRSPSYGSAGMLLEEN